LISIERLNDTKIKEIKEEKAIWGMTKPAISIPGNVHAVTLTPETNIVRRYRTITFINQESKPNVSKLIGINRIRSRGATSSMSKLNTSPARSSTGHPPLMLSAGSICDTNHNEKL
jgi:hypothetical protein